MNILITGASGLIGSHLGPFLQDQGHRVWKLKRGAPAPGSPSWDPVAGAIDLEPAGALDAVIHLAGENVAQPWKRAVRKRIRESRVNSTRLLAEKLAHLPRKPKVLICASATGFYGNRGDELLDEQSLPGHGFLPEICREWEGAAEAAEDVGIRVVYLRFGIVLSPKGGALKRMLPIFKWGLGGKLGNGHYYWSWIALEDVLGVVVHVLANDSLSGPINTVTPFPVTNAEFTRALAKAVKRPAFLAVPPFVLEVLLGQMADEVLLCSFRVMPARLIQSGFHFKYPSLNSAFSRLLNES
ncbi:MAG: uncharacterized protein JWM16_2771 [Verrucomicrobiales bacterium]|nr:uncharacterized protein [Verrucomicrobiales bacterium]